MLGLGINIAKYQAPSAGGLKGLYETAYRAYSLRRLPRYSGKLIRVRRDSDNAELDIGYDGNGDLDTTSLLNFVGASNGYVAVWYDQTENFDMVRSIASSQGRIVTLGVLDYIDDADTKPTIRYLTGTALTFTLPSNEIDTINSTYAHTQYTVTRIRQVRNFGNRLVQIQVDFDNGGDDVHTQGQIYHGPTSNRYFLSPGKTETLTVTSDYFNIPLIFGASINIFAPRNVTHYYDVNGVGWLDNNIRSSSPYDAGSTYGVVIASQDDVDISEFILFPFNNSRTNRLANEMAEINTYWNFY